MSYLLKTCQLHLKVMQHFSSLASFEVNLISYFSLDNFLMGLFQLYGLKKVPQACFLSVIFYFKYYLLPWATFLKGKLIILSQPIFFLKIALAVGRTWDPLVFHLFSLLKAVPKTARLLSPLPKNTLEDGSSSKFGQLETRPVRVLTFDSSSNHFQFLMSSQKCS